MCKVRALSPNFRSESHGYPAGLVHKHTCDLCHHPKHGRLTYASQGTTGYCASEQGVHCSSFFQAHVPRRTIKRMVSRVMHACLTQKSKIPPIAPPFPTIVRFFVICFSPLTPGSFFVFFLHRCSSLRSSFLLVGFVRSCLASLVVLCSFFCPKAAVPPCRSRSTDLFH